MSRSATVVFDLGGVVVQWDPVAAVAAAVGQERARAFVHGGDFDFFAWNAAHDAGLSYDDGEAQAIASHPHLATEIRAYRRNFARALPGLVPGMGDVLRDLHGAGVRLVGLTNFSAQTYPVAPHLFPEIFALFDDVVVSGAEGVAKPDPAIFAILERRIGQSLNAIAYVDDSLANVEAARILGMDAIHFTDAATLTEHLRARHLLPER